MYLARLRRLDDASTPAPTRDQIEAAVCDLGYFGVELVAPPPDPAFTIRCGTEARARELAEDLRRRVLGDEPGESYRLELREGVEALP